MAQNSTGIYYRGLVGRTVNTGLGESWLDQLVHNLISRLITYAKVRQLYSPSAGTEDIGTLHGPYFKQL